ncbi:MAG: hypothetical protein IT168_11530 [Bryobacterales bacterium]|nr:hypothetical protein [Bryobacterales bacterium]
MRLASHGDLLDAAAPAISLPIMQVRSAHFRPRSAAATVFVGSAPAQVTSAVGP